MSMKIPEKKRHPNPRSLKEIIKNPLEFYEHLERIPKFDKNHHSLRAQHLADTVSGVKDLMNASFKNIINGIQFLAKVETLRQYPDPQEINESADMKKRRIQHVKAWLDRIYYDIVFKDPSCEAAMNQIIVSRGRSQFYGKNRCMSEEEIINILIRIGVAMAQGKWKGPLDINRNKVRDPDKLQRLSVFLMNAENPIITDDEKFEQFLRRKEKREQRSLGKLQQTM